LPAIDLTNCAKGKWVTVKRPFKRDQASTPKDRLTISIHKEDASVGNGSLSIDDISIETAKN